MFLRCHADCHFLVQPLLLIKDAEKFILQGKNVLEDGVTDIALLHQVLEWTRSDAGWEDIPGKRAIAEARAKSVKKIVETHPHLLSQRSAEGIPPYQHALNLQGFFHTDAITKTLHTAIFDRLINDPDAVRHALYTKAGMFASASLVYQC